MIKNKLLSIVTVIQQNQFLIGLIMICVAFVLVRLPYYIYMPIPFINGDAFEYYYILHSIENNLNVQIGFPGIGYPLFISFCEHICNTTFFIVFMQSALQLFAVLLFFYYYQVYFKQHLLFVAIVIVGYVTSNINIYYDTAFHPDSIMGSVFIIALAILIKIIHKHSYSYFALLSVIVAYAIAVRANGILLIPLVVLYLAYQTWNTKELKFFLINVLIFIIPIIALCSFHYYSPLYKTFNVISYPVEGVIDTTTVIETTDNETWKSLQNLNLSKRIYTENADFYNDTAYAIYVMAYQRNYILKLNRDNNISIENFTDTRSVWDFMILDTCYNPSDAYAVKNYLLFKHTFIEKYSNKQVSVSPHDDFHHRLMHFIGFYKLFYKTVKLDNWALGYENSFYYENNAKGRYWMLINYFDNNQDKDKFLYQSVFKELNLKQNNLKSYYINKKDMDYWTMKSSRFYRWFIQPYYKMQPLFFRNFLYPIIFILITIGSLVGLCLSKFKSPLFFIALLSCLLLIMTNVFHSFYFHFLYTRYTYQVSFMYYIAVIFLPLIIESFLFYKKTGKIKY